MVGVKTKLLTASSGLAVMTSTFAGYKPYAGDFGGRDRGNLLSFDQGEATAYSLMKAQERGTLFIKSGEPVFANEIIGMNAKTQDLKVSVTKEKQLTNMRSA